MPEIRNYFEERQWTLKDYNSFEWTKHSDYNWYYLGNEKNTKGMPINCNGAYINADYSDLCIATFNERGFTTGPYIYISN